MSLWQRALDIILPSRRVPTQTVSVGTSVDILEVMRFNKPGYCLSGAYDILLGSPQLLLRVKNPIGYPVDIRSYDDKWIYDQQTEVNWQDPGFVKLHVGNGGRGNKIAPRRITSFPFTVTGEDSPVLYIKNGQWDFCPENAGPYSYVWHPPKVMSWGGDVLDVLTYPVDYFWSGVNHREQLFYAPPFGLVKFNHGVLQADGTYKIDNDPPASNKLQTLAMWRKTYPALEGFGYKVPWLSPVKFSRGTY